MRHAAAAVWGITLLLRANGGLAQETRITQIAGAGSMTIAGDGNIVLNVENRIEVQPEFLALTIARVAEQRLNEGVDARESARLRAQVQQLRRLLRQRERAVQARDREIAELRRGADGDQQAAVAAPRTDLESQLREREEELRHENAEILESSSTVRQIAVERLRTAAELERLIASLDEDERAEAYDAFTDADLDAVQRILDQERNVGRYQNVSVVFALVSDRALGAGGFAFGGQIWGSYIPGFASEAIGLSPMVFGLETVYGSLCRQADDSFFFELGVALGPQLRIGAPLGLVLNAYYYAPAFVWYADEAWAPFVGFGAGLGFYFYQHFIALHYRFKANSIVYPNEPDQQSLVLLFSFHTVDIESN